MGKAKKVRPIPERISQWDSCDRVLYKCPVCGCSFGFYCEDEKFCHNCGQEINWGVIVKVPEYIKNIYHSNISLDVQKSVCKVIIALNDRYQFNSPMVMAEMSEEHQQIFDDLLKRYADEEGVQDGSS